MKSISRCLCISMLAICCGACGGGSIDITVDPPPPLPEQPQVTVEGQTKQLVFSWAAVTGADHYRLMENPDGHSGFTQVGDDIPAGTLTGNRDIAVHLFDWVNAQYIVEACNVAGCSSSDVATPMDVMLDTIGYFKGSNTEAYDGFGRAVALSSDANTMAVSGGGAVYLFRFDGTSWAEQTYIGFGGAVALSADGNTLAVSGAGGVNLFRFDGTSWAQQANIKGSNTESGDGFGWAVALSADGNTLAVGAPWEDSGATGINGDQADNSTSSAGAVYLFRFDGQTWLQQAYVKASNAGLNDGFGSAVSLSADGNTLAIGIFAYYYNGAGVGAAYLFRFDGTSWAQQADIKASNAGTRDLFGRAVALSVDGDTLAVGATGAGAAYLFRFDGTSWAQQAYLKPSNDGDRFGFAVALTADGNTLAVGAPSEDSGATGINGDQTDNSASWAGAVYLFRFDGSMWTQHAYIKASNTRAIDHNTEEYGAEFGYRVALSADGNTLAVGAIGEGSSATGINGDQADNSAETAGAVYVY